MFVTPAKPTNGSPMPKNIVEPRLTPHLAVKYLQYRSFTQGKNRILKTVSKDQSGNQELKTMRNTSVTSRR